MPRALVTGGAGFIGSHVCELFLQHGYDVAILDDLSSGRRENVPAKATLTVADVASPEAAALVADGQFDIVCHLAAQMDVRKSVLDPMHDARINVLGSLNIFEAVRKTGRKTRVIFSSTGGAVYGDFTAPPNTETFSKDPESPYGIAKLAVEYYLAYYARVHGMDTVALRYANVYGPRQDPHGEAGVVSIFCNRILDGQPLTVFGDGEQTRDYVHVSDVARANLAAARAALPAAAQLDVRAYNIGTSIPTSVNVLAKKILAASKRTVPVQHAPARPGEQQRSFVAIDKAAAGLGWRPTVTLDEGLAGTFAWFAARRESSAGAGSAR